MLTPISKQAGAARHMDPRVAFSPYGSLKKAFKVDVAGRDLTPSRCPARPKLCPVTVEVLGCRRRSREIHDVPVVARAATPMRAEPCTIYDVSRKRV
jgi:hypothetical protein